MGRPLLRCLLRRSGGVRHSAVGTTTSNSTCRSYCYTCDTSAVGIASRSDHSNRGGKNLKDGIDRHLRWLYRSCCRRGRRHCSSKTSLGTLSCRIGCRKVWWYYCFHRRTVRLRGFQPVHRRLGRYISCPPASLFAARLREVPRQRKWRETEVNVPPPPQYPRLT